MTPLASRANEDQLPSATELLLEAVLEEFRGLRADLRQRPAAAGAAEGRHVVLLAALADAMNDLDLSFDASEVATHSQVDHGLAVALQACGASTPGEIGRLFRSLKGRSLGGLVLLRDGRTWRLERV